jgi:hypothetical protein
MPNPQISFLDYNDIRDKVVSILGSGTGPRGYGQTPRSSAVSSGEIIAKEQWDNLQYDIVNIKVHQDGVPPTIATVTPLDVIRKGITYPNTNYDAIIEGAILNRFNIGSGRSVVTTPTITGQTSLGTISRTGSWGGGSTGKSTCELTVSFTGANDTEKANNARYFFNSGGKIRFTSTRSGGTPASAQNNSWTNLLTTAGTQYFGASGSSSVTYYYLTNVYQTFYQVSASSSYASNNYKIEAKCDVSNNALGTAKTVTFRITWTDGYVDPDTLNPGYPNPVTIHPPGDVVDGTLSLTVEEFKATGPLAPSGTFTINSPTYSISAITVS